MSDTGNQFSGQGSGTQSYPIAPYSPFSPPVIMGAGGSTPTPESDVESESIPSNVDFLRLLLQEPIPEGGHDSDTLFLDEHLVAILNRSGNVFSYAAYIGWNIKAGAYAILTDRNDGLSEKKLSQAATAARAQAKIWQAIALSEVAQLGRTYAPGGAVFRPYDASYGDTWNQVWDVTHIDRFYLPWNVIEG